ncbi:MAG: hypothetical protein ACRCXZ_01455 [Patescibacteria group bacterium]
MEKYRLASKILLLSFLTGLVNMSAESLIGTASTYISGNGVVEMSRSMGVTFFGMFLATMFYHVAEYKGWSVDSRQARKLFVLNELCLGLLLSFTPLMLFSFYGLFPNWFKEFQLILTILNGAFTAFEIPLTTCMNEKHMNKLPENLTFVLSGDYLGGAMGTFLWIDFILKYIPMHYAGFILGIINLLIVFIAIFDAPKEDKLGFKDFTFPIGIVFGLMLSLALSANTITGFAESLRAAH